MVWSQYSILNIVIHGAQTPKYKNCLCCSSARILSWSHCLKPAQEVFFLSVDQRRRAQLICTLCSKYQVTVQSSLGVVKSFSFTGNSIWNIGQYMRSFIDILLQSRNRLKEMYHHTQNQPNGPHKDLSVSNQWIQNMVMILPHTPAQIYRLLPVLALVLLFFGIYRSFIIHKW